LVGGILHLLRKLILILPFFIKSRIIRSIIRFPSSIDPELHFKVAETQEELEQAFAILHDAYVGDGLMKPHSSGLRVTKYHSLHSTTTLVAVEKGIVVGTVSLVRKNSFGLPLEAIFRIDHLPAGDRIVEVSSLAIKKGLQKQRGRILFPLLKFMFHYSTEYFGVSHFVIAVNPKWFDFYQSVLLFTRLAKKQVESYDFVNGAPAIGGILDLKRAYKEYLLTYGGKSLEKNLFHFFTDLAPTNMEFPMRKKGMIWDPVLTPALMEYFFLKKTDTFLKLTEFELSILRELYNTEEYCRIIPQPQTVRTRMRKEKRFEARLWGRAQNTTGQSVSIEIYNVGMHSFDGFILGSLPEGLLRFRIDIEDYKGCLIGATILRYSTDGHFVAVFQNPPETWQKFIQNLDNRLLQQSSKISEIQLKFPKSKVS
jgi:hypothetical protein